MKIKVEVELEIDLKDDFIDLNDKESKDWLFKQILTRSNLFFYDREIRHISGDVTNILKCEEVK